MDFHNHLNSELPLASQPSSSLPRTPDGAASLGTAPPLTTLGPAGEPDPETGEGFSAGGGGGTCGDCMQSERRTNPTHHHRARRLGGARVGAGLWWLVCAPVVAVVGRLVDLGLLLNGGVLVPLSGAGLSVLLQVVVQNLRVGLLVRCQNVHEGGRSVAGRGRGVDGTAAPQRRGQAE